jgi:uncharacterized membrane protein
MSTTKRRKIHWLAVVFPIAGVALCVAAVVRGEWGLAVAYLAITFGFAAALVIFPRFTETVMQLSDDKYDERNAHLHRRASQITLNVLALLFVGYSVYDLIRGGGGDGGPYMPVAGVAAVTYFVSLLALNWRS